MKKGILVLLFLVVIMFSGAVYAEPPEIGTIILQPAPDSEVLDEVTVTTLPDGQAVHFGVKAQKGESGGYEVTVDPEQGTYNAIKKEIPADILQELQEMEKDIETDQQLKLNSIPSATYVVTRSGTGWLQTEDPINLKLCSTYSRLHWTPTLFTGYSDMWVWDANPSELGTHWYTKRTKNYRVTTDDLYAYSHAYAQHQNKDFGFDKFKTNIYHDVFVKGYFYAEYPSTATAYFSGHSLCLGEGCFLLHTRLYYSM